MSPDIEVKSFLKKSRAARRLGLQRALLFALAGPAENSAYVGSVSQIGVSEDPSF